MCNDVTNGISSWEHFYQGDTTKKRLFSFGFALSPWQTVDYVEYPSVGKFEGDRFDPRTWRPQTPTTAIIGAARRRRVLGGAARGGVHRRADPGGRPHRRVQRSGGREVPRRRADQAPRQDCQHLPDGHQPDRRSGARRERPADVRQRRGRRRRRAAARRPIAPPGSPSTTPRARRRPLSETQAATTTHRRARAACRRRAGSFIAVDISADSAAHPTWQQPVETVLPRDPRTAGSSSGSNGSPKRWRLLRRRRPPHRRRTDAAPASSRVHTHRAAGTASVSASRCR